MTIGVLIAVQLVFDVLLVILLVTVARGRRAPAAPPAWHDEFLQLAREVMAVADSLLEAPERGRAPATIPPAMPPRRPAQSAPALNPRDQAFALLRAGSAPDDVARQTGLLPGELRLITSLVASEQALRTRQSLPGAAGRGEPRTPEAPVFSKPNPRVPSGTALA